MYVCEMLIRMRVRGRKKSTKRDQHNYTRLSPQKEGLGKKPPQLTLARGQENTEASTVTTLITG